MRTDKLLAKDFFPSTENSSWFGVEAGRKSKYPHWDMCSSMDGSHRVFADFGPSVCAQNGEAGRSYFQIFVGI